MKILVFSDTHGLISPMERAIAREKPDLVFHLGDCVRDARQIERLSPLMSVPGNCDYGETGPELLTPELLGTRFFLTHGHRYGVKMSPLRAVYAAKEARAGVLLFGHTHRALCVQEEGLWVMNPGACGVHGTYGVIDLTEGSVLCRIIDEKGVSSCC